MEFTIKDELELGKKFDVLIRSRLPLVQDPEITSYINELLMRLSKPVPPQPFRFNANVVRHNAVNAFASPGGYVFIYTGLILAMEHEAELAGVIAHEMAHVTQRHIAKRIEQTRVMSMVSLLGALAGAFLGGEGGAALLSGSVAASQTALLSYSRADENEADQVGFNYLVKAGFPPQAMASAFKILNRRQWFIGGKIPPYYSTHPDINARIDAVSTRANLQSVPIKNRPYHDERFVRIKTLIRAKYSDFDLAHISFTKQLARGATPLAYMGLGILYSRYNKIIDAQTAFDNALRLAPDDPLVIREAGYFHYTKRDKKRGESLLQQAATIKSKDLMAQFYFASVLADNGQTTQAIERTKLILRHVPEDSEIHDMLAKLYGRNDEMFLAYLHMAYGALYENNKNKVKQLAEKTKKMIKTEEEQVLYEQFEKKYAARKEFW